MDDLERKIERPKEHKKLQEEKYNEFLQSRLSQLSTLPDTVQSYVEGSRQSQVRKLSPHEIIFERHRPQQLRHSRVNDKKVSPIFDKIRDNTLELINGEDEEDDLLECLETSVLEPPKSLQIVVEDEAAHPIATMVSEISDRAGKTKSPTKKPILQ